ncbi:hypothetical protein [Flavobacterium sp. CF136]|uniref:hypothetical protein n=1 Tax=Flavobacterium sp. (strain CF136) TaxID=1144313 RepID=UPI0002718E41|nr:hypothetical protein [Flavobacterium sp. CF136]EJL62810.1 hypothetical protein PMI10_02767 [Flavobacterium sp. CF136]
MKFSMKLVLSFSEVFPNENPKQLHEYLLGIDRKTLMKIGSFFLGFNHRGSQYSDPIAFMQMFFSPQNSEIMQIASQNIMAYLEQNGHTLENAEIPYVVSSLKFFEFAFNTDGTAGGHNKSEQQIEIDIFKAYLLLNEQLTKVRDATIHQIDNLLPLHKKATAILLFLQLHNFDLTNYDIDKLFVTQFLRALMFFDFLHKREDCKTLLQEFYKYFDVEDYKEYLKRILPLTSSIIKKDKEAHTDIVLDGSAAEKDIEFLNKLAIDNVGVLEDFDFKNIRATPIYRVSERTFRIISPLFAMELVYNGLYWKFKEINDKLTKQQKPKDLYGLKTFEFSEKFVLNTVLKEIFGERFVQKTGEELDPHFDGAPDYYVRNNNKIILFESKDIMLNAQIKESMDFLEIQHALSEKLYKKEDGTGKAVMQLISNVRKTLTLKLGFDTDYSAEDVIISPVLVLHYRMFNTVGLNKFINFWFQEELQILKNEGLNVSNVRPLVIIDIDTLIFNKDVFADRIIELENCLTDYQTDYVGYNGLGRLFTSQHYQNQALQNSFLPFAAYLDDKVDKMGLRKAPRDIENKGFKIFD